MALLVQYKAEERQWLRAAEARQREATEQEAEVRKVRNAVAWGEAAEQEAEVRKVGNAVAWEGIPSLFQAAAICSAATARAAAWVQAGVVA